MNSLVSAASADAADAVRFLRAWLSAPLSTGAQLPSGPVLSKAMAAAVDPAAPGFVVELGPGTGPVTKALRRRGIEEDRLVLVEMNPRFCALLRARYPAAHVLCGDAFAAPRLLEQAGIGPIAAVVSSLPLATLRLRRRQRLLLEWLRACGAGTPFIQFTYFRGSPVPVGAERIVAVASPMIWTNLWPARVWTYRRVVTEMPSARGDRNPPIRFSPR